MSSLLIDGRVVWGDASLHTVPAAYRSDARRTSRGAAAAAARRAGRAGAKTRSLRDVLSRRGGTFDLKHHAVTPDRQPRAMGRPERRRRLGVDARAAERRSTGGRDQRPRRRHTVRCLRHAAAAADGPSGRPDCRRSHARRRDHHVRAVTAESQPAQRRPSRDRRRAATGPQRRNPARIGLVDHGGAGPETPNAAVQSVDRALLVLEILATLGQAGVTEIAAELGVHKSTVSRLIAVLESRGYVEQASERGKYRLGFSIARLARASSGHLDLVKLSQDVCDALAPDVGETTTWRSWTEPGSSTSSRRSVPSRSLCGPGSVRAARRTPRRAARCCLPGSNPADVRGRLAATLESFTANTVVKLADLERELATVRERGLGQRRRGARGRSERRIRTCLRCEFECHCCTQCFGPGISPEPRPLRRDRQADNCRRRRDQPAPWLGRTRLRMRLANSSGHSRGVKCPIPSTR